MSVLDDLNDPDVIDDLNEQDVLDELDEPKLFMYVQNTPYILPTAPICFIAGSKVVTDQGIVEIQNIDETKHTIRNKKIVALTKTKLSQKYLVQIEKDALYNNVPNAKTTISPNHKFFYYGKMVPAKELIGKVEGVNKIQYNDEIVYNVLLENNGKMIVNNLISETLSTDNIIAHLYNSKLSQENKNAIIIELNEAINKNDVNSYIRIGKKLCKSRRFKCPKQQSRFHLLSYPTRLSAEPSHWKSVHRWRNYG